MPNYKRITTIIIILIVLITSSFVYLIKNDKDVLFLATTTSVDNTGLLDVLISEFTNKYDITVKVTARGSGVAVDLAKKGQVDAVLVHAPSLEESLIQTGFGINRTTLWYNYFIVAGPKSDPANISVAINVTQAFSRIYNAGEEGKTEFYSRGDQSGTHVKELTIWDALGKTIDAEYLQWYFETGTGMSATLTIANEKNGYVLSDSATFVQFLGSNELIQNLEILFTQDDLLYNPYSYIIVNPDKYNDLNTDAAFLFLQFLQKSSTQQLVENYKINNIQMFTVIT